MTTVVLDGRAVSVVQGETLLEACREHDVLVPTLCHADGLSDVATCRLCLVEVKGIPRLVPACATRAQDGMVVTTCSERLRARRRTIVELLLANGRHVCAICPSAGHCQLQALARDLGVEGFEPFPRPVAPPDRSRPGLAYDPGRCVLCTRCVRICSEVEGARALAVLGRGPGTRIGMAGAATWADGGACTGCGRCITGCPTGALFDDTPRRGNGA